MPCASPCISPLLCLHHHATTPAEAKRRMSHSVLLRDASGGRSSSSYSTSAPANAFRKLEIREKSVTGSASSVANSSAAQSTLSRSIYSADGKFWSKFGVAFFFFFLLVDPSWNETKKKFKFVCILCCLFRFAAVQRPVTTQHSSAVKGVHFSPVDPHDLAVVSGTKVFFSFSS